MQRACAASKLVIIKTITIISINLVRNLSWINLKTTISRKRQTFYMSQCPVCNETNERTNERERRREHDGAAPRTLYCLHIQKHTWDKCQMLSRGTVHCCLVHVLCKRQLNKHWTLQLIGRYSDLATFSMPQKGNVFFSFSWVELSLFGCYVETDVWRSWVSQK